MILELQSAWDRAVARGEKTHLGYDKRPAKRSSLRADELRGKRVRWVTHWIRRDLDEESQEDGERTDGTFHSRRGTGGEERGARGARCSGWGARLPLSACWEG